MILVRRGKGGDRAKIFGRGFEVVCCVVLWRVGGSFDLSSRPTYVGRGTWEMERELPRARTSVGCGAGKEFELQAAGRK
jgi:hypothetical protein